MWPNPQFSASADLVKFTDETLNEKLYFCAVRVLAEQYINVVFPCKF